MPPVGSVHGVGRRLKSLMQILQMLNKLESSRSVLIGFVGYCRPIIIYDPDEMIDGRRAATVDHECL
jgi:hypothetical protein